MGHPLRRDDIYSVFHTRGSSPARHSCPHGPSGRKTARGNGMALKLTTPRGGTLFYNRGRASLTRGTDAPLPYDPKGVERPRGLPGGDGAAGAVQWCILAMVGPPWGPYPFARPFRGRASLTRGYKVVRPLRGRQPLAIFYCSRQRYFNTMAAIFSSARSPARKYAKIRKT